MDRSANSTLILDTDQRTTDTSVHPKTKYTKEDPIDEKNTLLLNVDEEALNTTLGDCVAMLSGTSFKDSVDLGQVPKVTRSKDKRMTPIPATSLQNLPKYSMHRKSTSKPPSKPSRSPIESQYSETQTSTKTKIITSQKSVDWRYLQTKGKEQESVTPKTLENPIVQRVFRHKKSDSWDKSVKTRDSLSNGKPVQTSRSPPPVSVKTSTDSSFKKMAEKSLNMKVHPKTTVFSTKPDGHGDQSSKPQAQSPKSKDSSRTETYRTPTKLQEKLSFSENNPKRNVSPHSQQFNLHPRIQLGPRDSQKGAEGHKSPSRNIKALVSPRKPQKEEIPSLRGSISKTSTPSNQRSPLGKVTPKAIATISITATPEKKKTAVTTAQINLCLEGSPSPKRVKTAKTDTFPGVIRELDTVYNELKTKLVYSKNEGQNNEEFVRALSDLKMRMMNITTVLKAKEK